MTDVKYPLGYNPALDGIRGIAVGMVVAYHAFASQWAWFLGVDVFFVLSGFLITSILLKEYGDQGNISLFGFYKRRFLRLYPALLLVCAAFVVIGLIVDRRPLQTVWEAVSALTYITNWTRAFGVGAPLYLGHTWSLSVEEQFYLVWPLVVMLLIRARRGVTLVTVAAILLAAASLLWRIWLYRQGASAERIYNGTDTHADGLLIGSALAGATKVAPRIVFALGRFWPMAVAGLAAVFALPAELGGNTAYFGYVGAALATAVVVASAASDGLLKRALSLGPLVWVGRRSYGIYLWHALILVALLNAGASAMIAGSACIIGSLAVAALSYRFVEQPILAMRYRVARQPQTTAA